MANLGKVAEFVTHQVDTALCDKNVLFEVNLITEEIFSNIARYAYPSGRGNVTVRSQNLAEPHGLCLEFVDSGVEYNPLAKEDPDVALPINEREVGGLGIFIVKNLCDSMEYQYIKGKNVLRLKKFYQ